MAISTATELKTALANWLHRTDLTDRLEEFIALAEARFNRLLRVRQMEEAFASVALSSGATSLPAGFISFKELRFDNSDGWQLEPKPLDWIRDRNQRESTSDYPRYYAVTATQVVCSGPSGSIKGTYYKQIPSLITNASNWLLTSHPDIYLFGALEEAAIYTQDTASMQLWAQKAAGLLEHLQRTDDADLLLGGPIAMRAR